MNAKKLLIVLLAISLIVSACSPEVIANPVEAAGNPVDGSSNPEPVYSQAFAPTPPPLADGVISYTPIGAESGVEVVVFRPDLVNESLAMVPVGATLAMYDGPELGPADVVAAISVGRNVFMVALVAWAGYLAYNTAFEGVEDIVTTISVIYIPTSPHHHPEHDVDKNLEKVAAILSALTVVATGGPDPENKTQCFVLLVGDAVARFMVWQFDFVNQVSGVARGTILIWHANVENDVSPWVGIFSNKSSQTLLNVPEDLRDMAGTRMEQWDCSKFPPPPSLPMATP